VPDDDLASLETAVTLLNEVTEIFDRLDVGACALHLEACVAALESRLREARSGGRPLRRRDGPDPVDLRD